MRHGKGKHNLKSNSCGITLLNENIYWQGRTNDTLQYFCCVFFSLSLLMARFMHHLLATVTSLSEWHRSSKPTQFIRRKLADRMRPCLLSLKICVFSCHYFGYSCKFDCVDERIMIFSIDSNDYGELVNTKTFLVYMIV